MGSMEQIEQALRKSRELRRAAVRPGDGIAPQVKATTAATQARARTINLTPSMLHANRVIAAQMHHPVTDIYRSLRTQVLQALGTRGKTSIGITSANHGEGKTLTAVNLAIAMAMDVNHTVLLVDADLRNPGVAKCLGIEPELGLSDYLIGKAEIGECLIRPGIERLSLFLARSRIGNSAELLSSPQMSHLASELKDRYANRLIIYDLPPIRTVADAIGFLPSVDATLLVIRDGATRAAELNHAMELLASYNLIGTILNAAS